MCQIKAGSGGDEPGSSRASCDPIAGKFPTRLAVFVGSTNTPNSIVENAEFQQLVGSLDP